MLDFLNKHILAGDRLLVASLALGICILAGVPLIYTQVTLNNIQHSLPIQIMEEEREITLLSHEVSGIIERIDSSLSHDSRMHQEKILTSLDNLHISLERLRKTYDFDTLHGVASIHAILIPVASDLDNWLNNGIYGFPPHSREVLILARTRAVDAYNHSRKLSKQAYSKAVMKLAQQADRITSFRNSAVVGLLIIIVLALLFLYYFCRQRSIGYKLRRNESVLSSFMEYIPAELLLKSPEGQLLWASEYSRRLYGLPEDTDSEEPMHSELPEEINQELYAHERLVAATGRSVEREYQIPWGEQSRTFRVLKFPVGNSEQNPIGIGSIGIDISDTKNSEARFREFAGIASDWFWEMDKDLKFTFQSERFEEITGIAESEVLGKTREEAFRGRIDNPEKWEKHNKNLSAKRPYSMVFELTKNDGTTRTLQTQAVPQYGEDGGFLGYRGVGTDITDTTRAERERWVSEQRFRDFAEIASDFLWEMNDNLSFTYISDRYQDVAGISHNEMTGKLRRELWSNRLDAPDLWHEHFEQFKAHAEIKPFEFTWTRPDGIQKDIFINGKRLFDKQGAFIGYRGIARDITDIVKARYDAQTAQAVAESANRAKTDFLANISHEIRTPMTLIIGMTDMIAETSLNVQQRQYVDAIVTAGDSLLALINRILDMSKIESGYLVLSKERFNIKRLLDRLITSYYSQAKNSGIELVLKIENSLLLERLGDHFRLEQVVRNLLDNALKFTTNGKVIISVYPTPDAVQSNSTRFSVSDTGIGIPKEMQSKIFEAFVQQDASTTRKYGGTGLGLAICQQIVKAMGGTMWLESTENEGSTFLFDIDLPIPAKNPKLTSEFPTLYGDFSRPLHILLVEDEVLIRTLLNDYLQETPHIVSNAQNGKEAVQMVKENDFDLIIMDLRMPVMDGFSAAREIRNWEAKQFRKPLPLVALSASVMVEDVQHCLSAGFTSHLGKPIRKEKLLHTIDMYAQEISP